MLVGSAFASSAFKVEFEATIKDYLPGKDKLTSSITRFENTSEEFLPNAVRAWLKQNPEVGFDRGNLSNEDLQNLEKLWAKSSPLLNPFKGSLTKTSSLVVSGHLDLVQGEDGWKKNNVTVSSTFVTELENGGLTQNNQANLNKIVTPELNYLKSDVSIEQQDALILSSRGISKDDTRDLDENGNGYYCHTWDSGISYCGDWQSWKPSGYGTMTYPDGSKYVGYFNDGWVWGNGTYYYASGATWVGYFYKGQKHGYGIYTKGSYTIEGTWSYDALSGQVIETALNQWQYKGNWSNGTNNGYGVIHFASKLNFQSGVYNGNYYEGYFLDGLCHGKGKFVWEEGMQYIGDFYQNMRHGKGIYKTDSGYVYDGDWVYEEATGMAKIHWSDGNEYEGEVKKSLPDGEGLKTFASGGTYKGHFLAGAFVSFRRDCVKLLTAIDIILRKLSFILWI
jgi:hypothetical protein